MNWPAVNHGQPRGMKSKIPRSTSGGRRAKWAIRTPTTIAGIPSSNDGPAEPQTLRLVQPAQSGDHLRSPAPSLTAAGWRRRTGTAPSLHTLVKRGESRPARWTPQMTDPLQRLPGSLSSGDHGGTGMTEDQDSAARLHLFASVAFAVVAGVLLVALFLSLRFPDAVGAAPPTHLWAAQADGAHHGGARLADPGRHRRRLLPASPAHRRADVG